MNFLEFLGLKKVMEDTDTKNVVKLPVDYVKPAPEPQLKEHYRVGFTDDGQRQTTLTFINNEGWGSMTLTMNQPACEQLIKMLRATYQEEANDDQRN
jgi:hypothetical protein